MKKYLFLLIAAVVTLGASAEDYGIKVAGVSVTSSNCNNITGDRIRAHYSGEPYSAKYNPSTKTLTLTNVEIVRDGSDNRAIHNSGCDGLTIIFYKECYLYGKDSNPVKIDKNTTIKSREAYKRSVSQTRITGGNGAGAFYVTNGVTLKFDSASLDLEGGYSSSTVEGQKGTEKIEITNSYIRMENRSTGTSEGTYVLRDIGSLLVSNSTVSLSFEANKSPVYNLKSFTKSGNVNVLTSGITPAVFNSTKKTFVYSDTSSEVPKYLKIAVSVAINETNFPDLKNTVSEYDDNNNGYLEYSNTGLGSWDDEATSAPRLTISNISTLKGLSYLLHLQELSCTNSTLTSVDLTQNKELTKINLSGNALTSLKLPASVESLDCSNNKFTTLDLSSYTNLEEVICTENELTTLKFSPYASKLYLVYCDVNKIKGDAMTTLINSLPKRSGTLCAVNHSYSTEKNECTAEQVALATERGWTMKHRSSSNTNWSATSGCFTYDLWIGGTQLNSHLTSTGSNCKYIPDTKTLELGTLNISGTGSASDADNGYGRAVFSRIDGLTINMKGNVNASAADDNCIGVMLNGKTTIVGNGTLTVTGGRVGLQVYNGSLSVGDNVTLEGKGVFCGIDASGSTRGALTVKGNATVMAKTTDTGSDRSGISGFSALQLEDSHRIKAPTGAYWKNGNVVYSNGNLVVGDWVTIAKVYYYNLTYYIDGNIYKTTKVEEGATITPLTNPEDEYYYYAWEDEPATMPAHDVEVHAVITSVAPLLPEEAGGRPANVYYDMQGREVTNPVKGNIYILNGKKIVM